MERMKLLFLFLLVNLGHTDNSSACSSCGTGGNDPLILYPTDTWRLYAGLSATNYGKNINANGDEERNITVQEKRTYLLALGRRTSDFSFITVSVPYITNKTSGKQVSGQGDPSLSFRYTLNRQNILQPHVPQIQFLAGFKPGLTTSKFDNEDQRQFSDVLGTGFDELRVGLDIWSAMSFFNYGASYNYTKSTTTLKVNDQEWEQGDKHLANLTTGVYSNNIRLIGGLVQLRQKELTRNGESQDDSSIVAHNLFLTLSYRPFPLDELRVTWVVQGKHFQNKNTSQNNAVTIAYMRTL